MDLYSLTSCIPISINRFTQKCDCFQNHSDILVADWGPRSVYSKARFLKHLKFLLQRNKKGIFGGNTIAEVG